MNRNRFLSVFAAALAAAAVPALGADELPKAETILDRYVEATGGAKAYEKHKTETATMSMELPAQGIKGTGVRYADSDSNIIETVTIQGIGKIEMGIFKGTPWEANPMTGARLVTGVEKSDRLRDSHFNSPLHWRKLWKSAETTGVETVDGEECYKVVLTPEQGNPETNFFSKKTGLLLKRTKKMTTQMGEVPVEFVASNYKEFDGVKMPTRIVQKMAGTEIIVTADSVTYNTEIPAEKFEPPAEVKKLLAK